MTNLIREINRPYISIFFIFFCIVLSGTTDVRAQNESEAELKVIVRAELFFTALRDRTYDTAWNLLSEDSQNRIIKDSYDQSTHDGVDIDKETIEKNFAERGIIFQAWWNSFAESFDANMILEESSWKIGYVKKQKSEILITHRKSENPVKLQMFRQDRQWKVGFAETFWNRTY